MINFLKKSAILISFLALLFTACSDSPTHVAGTIIETNSGNSARTKIYLSTIALDLNAGDTLRLSATDTNSTNDTIYVYYYEKISDSLECAMGIMILDSVPVNSYDSISIYKANGDFKTIFVNWNLKEGTTLYDKALKKLSDEKFSLTLKEGFEDLSFVDEIFEKMPFAIKIPQIPNTDSILASTNPCLIDIAGNIILLDKSDTNDTVSDSIIYWGIMPEVYFSDEGTIDFDLLASCQTLADPEIKLARRVEHFDGKNTSFKENEFWMDSSNTAYLIEDFVPFVDNNISVSLWINADSSEQISDYARILGAKSEGIGFNIQQRGNRNSVNIRLDARNSLDTLSDASYNAIYGTAQILDGTWHNYAFTIKNDSIKVFADGNLIEKSTFIRGDGFKNISNPMVGDISENLIGGVDEIFFFDGLQSENWMRLQYALQEIVKK